MQYQPKNQMSKDRISIIKRSKSRKILQMPILTVHNQQKKKELMNSQPKMRRLFWERLKDKKDNNSFLRIVEKIPAQECIILKNSKQKKDNEIGIKIDFHSKYKTNLQSLSNRSITKLKSEEEYKKNEDKTYYSKLKQRLLKKLTKPKIRQGNFRQTLSCNLISYRNYNYLVENNRKKELISRRSLKKEQEKKNSKSLSKTLEKRIYRTIQEYQLEGWQINQQNKERDEFNGCSFLSEQF